MRNYSCASQHGAPSAHDFVDGILMGSKRSMSNTTATLNFPVPSALGTIDQ